MSPQPHLGMHHVAIRVKQLDGLRTFYVDLLGFSIEREIVGEELWLTSGRDTLVFLHDDGHEQGAQGLDHLGVIVSSAAEVQAWECHLRDHAVEICEPTEAYDDGSVGMVCRDPQGHKFQVLWHPGVVTALAPLPVSAPGLEGNG